MKDGWGLENDVVRRWMELRSSVHSPYAYLGLGVW